MSVLKIMRILRALRPLRVINKAPKLKRIVNCMVKKCGVAALWECASWHATAHKVPWSRTPPKPFLL